MFGAASRVRKLQCIAAVVLFALGCADEQTANSSGTAVLGQAAVVIDGGEPAVDGGEPAVDGGIAAEDGGAPGPVDSDGDGLPDSVDPCPNAAHKFGPGCVVDANGYQLVYDLSLPDNADWDTQDQVDAQYSYNAAHDFTHTQFAKIGYLLTLDNTYVWATVDDFTGQDVTKIGVPVDTTWDTHVSNVSVASNVANVSTTSTDGSVEMWSHCYSRGVGGAYDSDDDIDNADCYGSLQLHVGPQTVFAYNAWSSGNTDDVGIGTRPTDDPDWTFAGNVPNYTTRRLQFFILPDTDRDGTTDDVDTDDDNDGVDDAQDLASLVATQCLDDDEDGCDDCTNTGSNGSGGDSSHDCRLRGCFEIDAAVPSAQDGDYSIDPDGPGGVAPLLAHCDMSTDGGGWTLALNYVHRGGTNPDLLVRTDSLPLWRGDTLGEDESTDAQAWGHAAPALMNSLYACELRFDARTSAHGREMHFKTDDPGTLAYVRTGVGDMSQMQTRHETLPGHTANLPGGETNWYGSQGDLAMTEFPFWNSGTWHWGIRGLGNRWEVDDFTGDGSQSTIHRIWFRGAESDGDGVADCIDNCPQLANPEQQDLDEDGAGDACDDDDDNDGVSDEPDSAPTDPNECADADEDSCDDCAVTGADESGGSTANDGDDNDEDGTCNTGDSCPDDANKIAVGRCGCGEDDAVADPDSDGVCDEADGCPNDVNKTAAGRCGCGVDDTTADPDVDNVCGEADACPQDVTKTTAGTCGCGIAENPDSAVCKHGEADGDGVTNEAECPDAEACPDSDNDGAEDFTDPDSDGDGKDDADECPSGTCADADGDGIVDRLERGDIDSDNDGDTDDEDTDADGDGTSDHDECPTGYCGDADHDGIPDNLDATDLDGDGDTDDDGVADSDECAEFPCADHDEDGVPDYADPDSDNDGKLDGADHHPFNPCKPHADALACTTGDFDGDGVQNSKDKAPEDACKPHRDVLACPSGDTDGDGVKNGKDEAPEDQCVPSAEADECDEGGSGGTDGSGGESGSGGTDGSGGEFGSGGTGGSGEAGEGGAAGMNGEAGRGGSDAGDVDGDGDGLTDAGECGDASACPDTKHTHAGGGGGGCSATGDAPAAQFGTLLLPAMAALLARRRRRKPATVR